MPSYKDRYDRPAQAYEQQLASASAGEEQLAEDLWKRSREETEAQHAQQTDLAYAGLAGAGSGQGAMGLRSATYAGGQVGQQYANDAAMLAALEDQAYREQMMQVLGRRGEYGMAGTGFAADQYAAAAQEEAYQRMLEEQKKAQEAAETSGYVGMITGPIGAGIGAGVGE
jgi:hypothetical protein